MARRMRLPSREMGDIEVFTISTQAEKWEDEWDSLRGTEVGDLFSEATQDAIDYALTKWSRPLVDSLGIPPEGALRKLPLAAKECHQRKTCTFFDPKTCYPTAKNMPWCFEPGGYENSTERQAVAKAIGYWRDNVYLIVIREK